MAKVAEGMKQFTTQVTEGVLSGMSALASRLGRAFSREVEEAFRRHLAAPPRLEVPALPPAGPVAGKPAATPAPARRAAAPPPPAREPLASVPGLKRGVELTPKKRREEARAALEEIDGVRVVRDDDGPTVNAE